MDYIQLGQRIKSLRMGRQLTQEEMAERVKLSSQHISNVETGKTKVSLPALVDIANCLGVSMDQLVCESVICDRNVILNEYSEILASCSGKDLAIINQINQLIVQLIQTERD